LDENFGNLSRAFFNKFIVVIDSSDNLKGQLGTGMKNFTPLKLGFKDFK